MADSTKIEPEPTEREQQPSPDSQTQPEEPASGSDESLLNRNQMFSIDSLLHRKIEQITRQQHQIIVSQSPFGSLFPSPLALPPYMPLALNIPQLLAPRWPNPAAFLARMPYMGPIPMSNVPMTADRRVTQPPKPAAVKKYKCDTCGKAFSRSNTLITHKRIHTGEKPFKCEHCGRAFRQPGNLTRHRLTHTTVKPYICTQCGKAFNRASNLHTHLRTHNSYRPFVCPYCGKGFHQKIDMKIHIYTHTGQRPYNSGNI